MYPGGTACEIWYSRTIIYTNKYKTKVYNCRINVGNVRGWSLKAIREYRRED